MELKSLNFKAVIHAFLSFIKFEFSNQFSLMNFQYWKSSEYVNSTPETPQVLELDLKDKAGCHSLHWVIFNLDLFLFTNLLTEADF